MGLSVLHVAQSSEYGLGRYLADLVADQRAAGWAVTVAGHPESWLRVEAVQQGVGWVDWKATRDPGPSTVGEVLAVRRIIRAVDPDVVHLHSSKAGLAGRAVLRGRRPTLFQPHAWSFLALATGPVRTAAVGWERIGARWAHAVVCCSEAERVQGGEAGINARYRVVPNAVDTDRFAPRDRAEARAVLGLDADAPLAVCVGRLAVSQKGQDVLLDAWPSVVAQVPDARLVLVGDGPDRAALESAASSGVHFAGHSSDIAAWYAAADVVVQPSRYEGLSLALLEAMASGRAVVAADATGMREALGDGGEVVPVGDSASLARAVVQRLVDPDRAALEGCAARRRVEERYGRRRWAEELQALTLEVADVRRSGPSR